ncbi:MAG: aldo/keto reductase [Proteobacteria bacterium]|nr:aldo/keto reductase [Pseudomonadota bacterium]
MSEHPSIAGIPLVLGGNVFGWTADEDASFAILDAFFEAGGRMIDTAECYSFWVPGHSGGESETVIGKWLASRGVRSEMRIATKTNVMAEAGGLAPQRLAHHLTLSLERLQTDYLDLFYAHRDDPETPQVEVAEGFEVLRAAGRIRESGASNFTAQRLDGAIAAARGVGAVPYGVLQNEYNLVHRESYDPALQAVCRDNAVAFLPYYGLASGFLTGKYRSPEDFNRYPRGGDLARYADKGARILPIMDQIAARTGADLAEIALAWLLARPEVTAPIASVSSTAQLPMLLRAVSLELDPQDVTALDTAY